MYVVKRDGRHEEVQLDKITARIRNLTEGLDKRYIDPVMVALKVVQGIYPGVTTRELDTLAAETCAYSSTYHPDWSTLAARIAVSDLHKRTDASFSRNAQRLRDHVHPKTGAPAPLLAEDVNDIIQRNAARLDAAINYERDFDFDYFGFKTLERSYLLRIHNEVAERPQHMYMRVSVGIHKEDIDAAIETYNLMSSRYFTHATPTLFNAGTPRPQLSSCFLLAMKDDSIDGIYATLKDCACISKYAGGIGLSIHNIRATHSYIRGTNGSSNGIVPMLRVFSDTARYVDQCFTPETIVYTKNGPLPIGDLAVGMEVVSGAGRFQPISRVVTHDVEEQMLCIGVEHTMRPVKVTRTHQVLALRGQAKDVDFTTICHRLAKGLAKPEWVDAGDLNVDDFVCFPTPCADAVVDVPTLSLDDCRMYGLLLGSGHVTPKLAGNSSYVHLSYGAAHDAAAIDFVKTYFASKGVRVEEDLSCAHEASVRLQWSSDSEGALFVCDHLYDETGNKRVHACFMNLPTPKLQAIIRGLLDSSAARVMHVPNAGVQVVLSMTAPQVSESVRYILMRCGILSSGATDALRIASTPVISDMLPSPVKSEHVSYLVHDGLTFSRIQKVEEETYTGRVYDLEVDVDHTYVTHMGVVHNGGGKRKGSFAIYLEPWHADVFDFLDLKKNHGKEENRARDLFYALWIPDLFMERVESDGTWSLFCPNEAPGLSETYGAEFKELYERYEREGRARSTIKAQELWFAILASQIETGTPYMLYKDACNSKSNQKNLGVIKSSNLCTEILEYTSADEIAVCNLASIAVNMFVKPDTNEYDFDKLVDISRTATRNLNKVIDVTYYPVEEAKRSNLRHRPIGIGIQGLADALALMRYPFESDEARALNTAIFEAIYFGAVSASCELAESLGPYETFAGSPASQGILQFDMWGVKPSSRWDWDGLKARVVKYGLRNSLLLAPMPTASTAQILGNNESFEPFTSNIYSRRVLAGDFPLVNRHLVRDLISRDLWNATTRMQILADKGSIQRVPSIPDDVKALYKTVWEIKQRSLIDMSADRGAFICQSQSLNLFIAEPTQAKLTSAHFHAWKKGLKTGMYYLRTQPKADAIAFTVEQVKVKEAAMSQHGISADLALPALSVSPAAGAGSAAAAAVGGAAAFASPAAAAAGATRDEATETSSPVVTAEDRMTAAEKRKAAIRAALANDTYEADADMCISCGS